MIRSLSETLRPIDTLKNGIGRSTIKLVCFVRSFYFRAVLPFVDVSSSETQVHEGGEGEGRQEEEETAGGVVYFSPMSSSV